MLDEPDFAELDENVTPPAQPRLGMAHVMLWTACVAISLGLQRWQQPGGDGIASMDELASSGIAVMLLYSLITSLWLAAPLLAAARWYRGLSFPQQPGEWILLINGFSVWISGITDLLLVRLDVWDLTYSDDSLRWFAFYTIVQMVGYALYGGGLVVAAVWLRREKLWATCLGAWAVVVIVAAASMTFSSLTYFSDWDVIESIQWLMVIVVVVCIVAGTVSVGTFFAALIMDFKRNTRRGWLHVVGVASVVVMVVLSAVIIFVEWIFPNVLY